MATVVLTRPHGKNDALAQVLTQHGVDCINLPALSIMPTLTHLEASLSPENHDVLVFVSAQAAQLYLDAMGRSQQQFLPHQAIATVGAASAAPFYQNGLENKLWLIHPPATHPYQDSEALWVLLKPHLDRFKRFLLVRGQHGREWLGQQLLDHHKVLTRCSIYKRIPAYWSGQETIQLQSDLVQPQAVTFLLTSSESTQAIYENMVRLGLESVWKQAQFVAIHPRIAEKIQQLCAFTPQQMQDQVHVCAPRQMAMQEALLLAALPK